MFLIFVQDHGYRLNKRG